MSSQHPACPRTRVCTFPNKFHTARGAAHRSRRTSRERMLPSLFSGKQEHAKSSSLVLSTTRALAKITLSLGPTAQRFPQAFLKASCSATKSAHLQGQSRKKSDGSSSLIREYSFLTKLVSAPDAKQSQGRSANSEAVSSLRCRVHSDDFQSVCSRNHRRSLGLLMLHRDDLSV